MPNTNWYTEKAQQHDAITTAWLSTTGSQIFFMQLGFLCYEVGYVKPVWTQSVILKNIEDTFVGILTFLVLGYTLSESKDSLGGIIAKPVNPFLIGVGDHLHDQILILAFFASTCATIISGAVLERMKNKAYITWCFLTILINYSFISHWVWHKDGWLNKLGFVDGAGSVVVHSTAGMAALIAVWRLGPRTESIPEGKKYKNNNIELLPTACASNPIIHTMGAFFLWYGWFAFNVASPIAFSKGIGDAIGTTALVTVISPITATCSAFIWMHFEWVELSFENLLSCLLAGLVSVTGMCHTIDVWESATFGFFSSVVYFGSAYVVRYKFRLDDPMQIIAIHLICGIYSGIGEGFVANKVYGTPGLLHGGYRHFGVQVLGVIIVVIFNFCVSLFLWEIILKRILFRKEDIRVSILDIYLGTRLFDQNYEMALNEVLNCGSNASKEMLFQFHEYVADRYALEQLDFLIVCKTFKHYLANNPENNNTEQRRQMAKYILEIIDTYVAEHGEKCINISGTQRCILIKIENQLINEFKQEKSENGLEINNDDEKKEEKYYSHSASSINYKATLYNPQTDECIFDAVCCDVRGIVMPHFVQFLKHKFDPNQKFLTNKFELKIPFTLLSNWIVQWDQQFIKDNQHMKLADTVPPFSNSDTLLNKITQHHHLDFWDNNNNQRISTHKEMELAERQKKNNYPIIFVDEQNKIKVQETTSAVVIIE